MPRHILWLIGNPDSHFLPSRGAHYEESVVGHDRLVRADVDKRGKVAPLSNP